MQDVHRLMCENTSKLAGLKEKGRIAEGYDADLVVWAPDETFQVSLDKIR